MGETALAFFCVSLSLSIAGGGPPLWLCVVGIRPFPQLRTVPPEGRTCHNRAMLRPADGRSLLFALTGKAAERFGVCVLAVPALRRESWGRVFAVSSTPFSTVAVGCALPPQWGCAVARRPCQGLSPGCVISTVRRVPEGGISLSLGFRRCPGPSLAGPALGFSVRTPAPL